MNKHEICINAGKVWHLLCDNAKGDYGKLKIESGLNDKELATAIGWLAREDKIDFEIGEKDVVHIFMNVNVYIG